MTADDLAMVLEWRNHPDVRQFMYTQHQISMDEHRQWFERVQADSRKHLLIFEVNAEALGFINFSESASFPVCDWGFYVAPCAPKGTGFKMGTSALTYAFNELSLHKVCGQALSFNQRSISFHLKLGFFQEGRLREQFYDGQQYHDVVCFGLLADEWKSRNEELM